MIVFFFNYLFLQLIIETHPIELLRDVWKLDLIHLFFPRFFRQQSSSSDLFLSSSLCFLQFCGIFHRSSRQLFLHNLTWSSNTILKHNHFISLLKSIFNKELIYEKLFKSKTKINKNKGVESFFIEGEKLKLGLWTLKMSQKLILILPTQSHINH